MATRRGGRTFPLRGAAWAGCRRLRKCGSQSSTRIVFNVKSKDPRDADVLLAAFARAGVKPGERYSFYGDPAVTGRLRALVPGAWTYGKDEAGACLKDYLKLGWTGFVPASCRDTTVAVPLNYQWAIWGWPNRFLDRMAGANTKVIMFGNYRDGIVAGNERSEQLAEVPRDFRGYLWIEDFYTVGRSLQR